MAQDFRTPDFDEPEPRAGRHVRASRRPLVVLVAAVAVVVLVSAAVVVAVLGHGSKAVAAGAPVPSPSATSSSGAVSTRGFPTGPGVPGIFTDRCAYSHEAADDPIMYPGLAGASMHHDFFGNTGTTAASTAASLLNGATTCTTSADSSAYWAPVLEQNGRVLTPGTALIYWRRPVGSQGAVHTIPVGLQMIAGNEAATAPQSTSVISWGCAKARGAGGAASGAKSGTATPHACPAGRDIRLTVFFPSCWDGKNLGGMGQTNVVYPVDHACPSSHPVPIPQVVFHVAYPTSTITGLTMSTSPTAQGSIDTAHVDFINGWSQSHLDADVAACDATSTRCGPVTGPDATPREPTHAASKAGPAAPARGAPLRSGWGSRSAHDQRGGLSPGSSGALTRHGDQDAECGCRIGYSPVVGEDTTRAAPDAHGCAEVDGIRTEQQMPGASRPAASRRPALSSTIPSAASNDSPCAEGSPTARRSSVRMSQQLTSRSVGASAR